MSKQPDNGIHALVMRASGQVHVTFPEGGLAAVYLIDDLRENNVGVMHNVPETSRLEILAIARFRKACLDAAAPFEVEAGRVQYDGEDMAVDWTHISEHRTLREAYAEYKRQEGRPVRNLRVAGETLAILTVDELDPEKRRHG